MFEGIDRIDWNGLNASNVPSWLKNLASQDKHISEEAFILLQNEVVHSDALIGRDEREKLIRGVEIAYHVTPFLIEAITYPEIQNKRMVLVLLEDLISYTDLKLVPLEFSEKATLIHQLICTNRNRYVPLLSDRDHGIRFSASVLLVGCGTADELAVHLLSMTSDEENEFNKYYIISEFGRISKDGLASDLKSKSITLLESILKDTKNNSKIRCAAAVGLVEIAKFDVSQSAIETFIDTIPEVENYELLVRFLQAIKMIDRSKAVSTAIRLIEQLQNNLHICYTLLGLFDIIFEEGKLSTSTIDDAYIFNFYHTPKIQVRLQKDDMKQFVAYDPQNLDPYPFTSLIDITRNLTSQQKSILDRLLSIDKLWDIESNICKLYGLPSSHSQLRALIS